MSTSALLRTRWVAWCRTFVLRDADDGFLYVLDANNTPTGPCRLLTKKEKHDALSTLAETFVKVFLSPVHSPQNRGSEIRAGIVRHIPGQIPILGHLPSAGNGRLHALHAIETTENSAITSLAKKARHNCRSREIQISKATMPQQEPASSKRKPG